ncbi:MAG: restriction endonuclease subunit S [Lachnospiraceae bacterium]|nr:restriction endonuclease subunit S [Lachnospiraceae bacterium]
MSKLKELIAEFCPNGVEYYPLEEVATIKARIGWQGLTKKEYLAKGEYYLVTGVDFENGKIAWDSCHFVTEERYTQDANIQLRNGDVLVTKDGTLGKVAFVEKMTKPATLNSGVFVIRPINNTLDSRFLYHYLNSSFLMKFAQGQLTGGTIKHLNQGVIVRLPLPVPPLEVQREIVRILDSFTLLTAELTAELTARRRQYEYYRNKLLSYDKRLPPIMLNDIVVSISSGNNKERLYEGEFPVFGSTGIIAKTNTAVYDHEQILIARVGANAGYVHIARGQYDVSDNTLIIDVKQGYLLKYIYYMLVNMNLNQYAKGGGQPLITAGELKKLSISMPKYEVQKRIVSVLDNFDTVCTDVNIGLPAEIEARQKQYEYYRDKLLTFKELSK